MVDQKYIPQLNFQNRRLSSIKFKIDKIVYTIQIPCNFQDTDHTIEIGKIETFEEANETFYNWIVNKNFISKQTDQVNIVEDAYRNTPLSGYFKNYYDIKTHTAIDRNKSYASLLKELKYIPIFNEFDNYEKYDYHSIEDYTKCIIEVMPMGKALLPFGDENIESSILFDGKISMIYGYILNRISGFNYKILFFRRPSNLHDINTAGNIELLFGRDLSEDDKKYIANVIIGMLEIRTRRNVLNKLFLNAAEARFYAKQHGGIVHKLRGEEIIVDTGDDDDIIENYSKRSLYVLKIKKECVLDEGFTPIKDLIYNLQRFHLWNVYRKLKSNGFVPLGTNTDSVIVDGNYESLHKNFQFSREFGRYKFEREKKLRNKPILLTINDIVDFKIMSVNTIYIESEKDFDLNIPESILKYNREVISILNDHKVLFIGSGLPGSGKSVAAALGCNKDEILFCTSYNMLVDVLMMDGNDAITNNKLLNLRINDDVTCAQNKVHFDVSPYKRIVFDEVLLCDPEMLSRLYRFMLRFPDKQIIATGDIDQLDCINFNFNNVSDQSKYMKKCIEFLFPKRIVLKVIKRLETEEDRKNVENLKIDLFNENNNLMDVINKYDFNTVDNMDNVQTDTNITYFRSKALEINQLKQNK